MFQKISNLSSLLSLQYKVFHNKICIIIVYVVGYIHVFFLEFLKTLKYRFQKNSKKGLPSAWVPNWFFGNII
jgi:hypothetical protein